MAGPVAWCSPDNHACHFMSHPLKKTVRRKQAPTAREGIAEGGLTRDRLRARIDRLEADTGVAGPGRNQAPASQREVPLRCRWILANNSDGLRRGDVVARLPIDLVISLEVFCDQLLASGQTIAATHLSLLRSSNNVMELTNRRDTYSACRDPGLSFLVLDLAKNHPCGHGRVLRFGRAAR